jgi:hypothetical protein
MSYNIEDFNRQLIACRMLNHRLNTEHSTTQPVVNQRMVESVRDYHKEFGIVPRYAWKRAMVKTRKFTRTVCP